jgi:hypothetical protein
MLVLSTNFAIAQDFMIQDNVSGPPPSNSPTTFLVADPLPISTTTSTRLEVGKGWDQKETRGVFFGGNLGVSQTTFNYGNAGGKWSFTGKFQKYYPTGYVYSPGTYQGNQYLVNYHRWGNYSAHFGLVPISTYGGETYTWTDSDLKNAVISWGYEHGSSITPNRLIFQSMKGVDESGASAMEETEWATILSNGNIGSGTPTPGAQMDIKPISSANGPDALRIFDLSNNQMFRFTKAGKLLLGGGSALSSGTAVEVLDVLGNVKFKPNITSALTSTNKNFAILNHSNAEIFSILDNGGSMLNGALTIKGKSSGTPLAVTNNSDEPIFRVTNAGEIFLDKLAPASGTLNLKVDNSGKIIATTVPYTANTAWEVGGNTMAGGSLYELGTFSYDDVNLVAGGVTSFSLDGDLATRGQMQIVKATSIGGNTTIGYATPNADWALSLKPIATGTGQGSLRILNSSNTEILGVGNTNFNFFQNAFRIFADEVQTRITIRPEFGYSNVDLGYSVGGSSNGTFRDIWYQGDATDVSDRRVKENIKKLDYGLAEILKLNPKSYFQIISKRVEIGFIAQELAEVLPECAYIPQNDSNLYGVRYMQIIPVLTNAIQEQQSIIDSLKQKVELLFISNSIKSSNKVNSQSETLNQLPLLFQNQPNPFNGITYIDYFLPINTSNAFIRVIDNNGKLVKAFQINKIGFGQIELDCTNLAEGTYHYSLLVNKQLIDTKKMVIASAN